MGRDVPHRVQENWFGRGEIKAFFNSRWKVDFNSGRLAA
jgi:allophanate hydrolase subunit 2